VTGPTEQLNAPKNKNTKTVNNNYVVILSSLALSIKHSTARRT